MNAKDKKVLTAYKITESSTDETFRKGQIIWFSEDGCVNFAGKYAGFLSESQWNRKGSNDFEFEEAPEYRVESRIFIGGVEEKIVQVG